MISVAPGAHVCASLPANGESVYPLSHVKSSLPGVIGHALALPEMLLYDV